MRLKCHRWLVIHSLPISFSTFSTGKDTGKQTNAKSAVKHYEHHPLSGFKLTQSQRPGRENPEAHPSPKKPERTCDWHAAKLRKTSSIQQVALGPRGWRKSSPTRAALTSDPAGRKENGIRRGRRFEAGSTHTGENLRWVASSAVSALRRWLLWAFQAGPSPPPPDPSPRPRPLSAPRLPSQIPSPMMNCLSSLVDRRRLGPASAATPNRASAPPPPLAWACAPAPARPRALVPSGFPWKPSQPATSTSDLPAGAGARPPRRRRDCAPGTAAERPRRHFRRKSPARRV